MRELHPLPLVPDVMEPLGPERPPPHRAPTWEQWVTSLCPPVRQLPPGEQPRDWANDVMAGVSEQKASAISGVSEQAASGHEAGNNEAGNNEAGNNEAGNNEAGNNEAGNNEAGNNDTGSTDDAHEHDASAAPARRELPPITTPQQYQMQFSTSEQHVRLVERAKALLARTSAGTSLGELHEQAVKLLVAKLEKEKFALTERPRSAREASLPKGSAQANRPESVARHDAERSSGRAPQREDGEATLEPQREDREATGMPRGEDGEAALEPQCEDGEAARMPQREDGEATLAPRRKDGEAPRRRVRHVPAAVKREVFLRDEGRCGYVDEQGCRCRETRYLELHHLQPFALGGEHFATNLALRCAAHNALAAESDFGRCAIEPRRHSAGHDSLAAQRRHELAESQHGD